ncbi:MAG: CRISPR-associated endonuclease Cas2 [Clostridiales bacterium]|jgi:CRISPR-associated protein Cas2|nr:CRISPR-associated endonuclease Cas2 [Clostridiales bacterium]
MLVLITYDVSTETADGKKRLARIAKRCVAHGQRVQNSVFECILDSAQLVALQSELKKLMNAEEDSLRFYRLGDKYASKVDHFGIKPSIPLEGTLII